ncbi:helix-turn-helix transcriptional regulator [Kitasatospora sp. YST-16]|uniref:helix-turn-helix transcriptional regulator n=1 Tax=Kitasatospora sp. YST-16 TaxID=2998080 RepID=UPI002283B763|nr:helix-turn-helix transcriptional regulator [Kitasatospora sp. YST-16]WAL72569.1 helix-turn-helix transcriptional regulator [Kitasatospora sp. YST-16]WNW38617.1 helix-turn-helix transcriptional regulator [Streptomyces sp. Li-HN-5-13]
MIDKSEDFGPWLGRQLRRREMTQAELATLVGVTRAAVSAWITGRAQPRPDTVRQIANAFETDLATVYERTSDAVAARPVGWYHRPAHADGGREFGNAAAFAFETDLGVLAREATQNSLDERLDPARPVRVRYTLHELTGEHRLGFLEAVHWKSLETHYAAAAATDQKVGRALAEGLREMNASGSLLLLRIDDYNANGLTGPEYGDGRFAAVVRRQLDSHKGDNRRAGGSYGLGKATLWAASRLGLVLVNSTLSVPHEGRTARRLIGRLDLPWHEVGGEAFAGPAWFGEPDSDRAFGNVSRSWWGTEQETANLWLEREGEDPGTSFLVVGAHDAAVDEDGFLDAVHDKLCDSLAENFWAAMTGTDTVPPLLEASVRTVRNGQSTRETAVRPERSSPALARALRAYLDGRTVPELTGRTDVVERAVTLTVPPLRTDPRGTETVAHDAVLLLTPADDTDRTHSQVVSMRGNRMRITSRRPRNLGFGVEPYQAVLLAGFATARDGEDVARAEAFLRASEPPEHNRWEWTEELSDTYVRGAKRRLDEFRVASDEAVRSIIGARAAAPADDAGPALLRNLLKLPAAGGGGRAGARRSRGYPTVDDIDGRVDPTGAWSLRVRIAVPQQDDPLRLSPIACFGAGRSGTGSPVLWAELNAEENCSFVGDVLVVAPGVRTATFSGTTDVDSHPVNAGRTNVTVNLRKAVEGAARP